MLSAIIYILADVCYSTDMNEDLLASLEELGLSQKEARVYLANLMIGPASVQRIADQAGIKRVTAYVILESLANLGLASQSTKGKKTYFTSEDPISLRRLLEKKADQVKEQKANFESVLPDLKALKSLTPDAPVVKFYEGVEGIRSIVQTFPQAGKNSGVKEVYGISNLDQVYTVFPEFKAARTNPERVKLGLRSRYIYTTSEGAVLKANDKQSNRESRFVPSDKYPISGDISISGDNVILFSFSGAKPIGVTIKSAEVAKAMKALFEIAWDAAEKYNK